MKRYFLQLLLFVAGLLPLQADNITVDGTSRSYNVYAPKNLGESRPLLIFCHGYSQDANWMQNNEFKNDNVSMEAVCDTAKFVVVFPNGINNSWDTGGDRDINFIKAIIEKMATQYKIDRNRVYLGGFSMGGMLTYHAMNKIPDLIAAFCPVSGYPMGGATANASVRPIPILHIHGTGDGTCSFSGVQPALDVWIKHNGCPTTAKVVNNYNGFNAKMHTWGPGNNGVEVKLLELADKGHWICKEPQVYTGKEIWNFCKRFSLELKDPTVRISTPKDGLTYVTFGGPSEVSDLTIKATASDPDGRVANVSFYEGKTLLASFDKEPYTYQLEGLAKGEHTLSAVVTDDEGRTSTHQVTVSVVEPATNYLMNKVFTVENSVPDGWSTYDGSEKRNGFSSGYSNGPRVFHFTGTQHDFEWGLYTRNTTGAAHAGYARFGDRTTQTTMTCYPGKYRLMCRVANWNRESFSPVTVAVETVAGKQVWAETFTPTANIGNAAANDFSGTTMKTYDFEITEKGRYYVTYYTEDSEWADLVVGVSALRYMGALAGIESVGSELEPMGKTLYNMAGQRVERAGHGPYIERTVMANGSVRTQVKMK
jgi:poly(3-hydroxybutyrate) depolymerase